MTIQLLQDAITYFREAVGAVPVGHPDRPAYLNNLGNALRARFACTGQQADLDQAITLFSEAAEAIPADHPGRPLLLANLAPALGIRFERTGQQADLDQAITFLSDAVGAVPAGHPDRLAMQVNLGVALRIRFERTGQQADLDQAITLLTDAVAAARAGHPGRSLILSNLGNALGIRFERTGRQADLDQAIALLSEALGVVPAHHPDRPAMLSSLGNALRIRFARTGQEADLDQAITLLSDAVGAAPVGHPILPAMLSNLSAALRARFERTGQQADLDRAITESQKALDAVHAGHPGRPAMLFNLGVALGARFVRTGQQADQDRAIARFSEAVGATPADHPDRPRYLTGLGVALGARFVRTGQQADLDRAIARFSEAVGATPADHPDRPRYLTSLGVALRTRFQHGGPRTDLDQAIGMFQEGAGVQTASPAQRMEAATAWAQGTLLAGDPSSAVEGWAAAIKLLPVLAWHGLDQTTRAHHLREWAGLAPEAAAAAVAAGHPARAVELLEAGRSMLWTQALHLRQDLTALRERAPGLAAVLETSRAVLDGASTSLARDPDTAGNIEQVRIAEQQMLEDRRQAARDWDATVKQIRQIQGFEHFLRTVPFSDLRAAAAGGPVIIVNISRHSGSHALIVTPATGPNPDPAVAVVDLPDAPMDTVTQQANTLIDALARIGDPATDRETKQADRHAVFEILAWCWQAITEPVLATLGHTDAPSGRIEDWPRVWWCPTGPATVLPLHAAGRHPRTATQYTAIGEAAAIADSVAGRVISSYTPTLTALTRSRTMPAPVQVRQLAVGVPEAPSYAPGASSLPAVTDELRVLASYLPQPGFATHRLGADATRQAVLEALPGHPWLHLSCHGVQHPADPSLSAFYLHDQPLTLADLAALHLSQTDLAYLSACQTATGDFRLLDEARHLAGALQLIGYRHVLATLWNISDAAAPRMADTIYAHLRHPDPEHRSPTDRPLAARSPYALHHAVARLRQARPGEPLLWAPYIHLGP